MGHELELELHSLDQMGWLISMAAERLARVETVAAERLARVETAAAESLARVEMAADTLARTVKENIFKLCHSIQNI